MIYIIIFLLFVIVLSMKNGGKVLLKLVGLSSVCLIAWLLFVMSF
jgi:hypothetical protein